MATKRKLFGAIAAASILVPTLATIVSCSCSKQEEDDPEPDPPGPGPTPPTPTVTHRVTFAGDNHTKLSKNFVTVDDGKTFGSIKNQVTATKTVNGKDWTFLHWSAALGGSKLEDSTTITSDMTVYACFEQPVIEQRTITFVGGPDITITIDGQSKNQITVDDGTTFGQVTTQHKIVATRTDGAEFTHWYFDEDDYKSKMVDTMEITSDINLYPYFFEEPTPEDEWTPKEIIWEKYGETEDKKFVLKEDVFSNTISSFLVMETGPADPKAIELQDGETVEIVSVTVDTTKSPDFSGAKIKPTWIRDEDAISSRLNINFAFNDLPTDKDILYDSDGVFFNVELRLMFKGEEKWRNTFTDLNFVFTEPWEPAKVEYNKNDETTIEWTTDKPGDKDFYIHSANNATGVGQFKLDRPLADDEQLTVELIGDDADLVETTLLLDTQTDATTTFIDISFKFKNIQNIFEEMSVSFKLRFIVTLGETRKQYVTELNPTFKLIYHNYNIKDYQCALSMDSVIFNDTGKGSVTVDAFIQNKTDGIFPDDLYLVVSNDNHAQISHEHPVWFTTPCEEGFRLSKDESKRVIPLRGNNAGETQFELYFDYVDHDESRDPKDIDFSPTEPTTYNEKVKFDFYLGDPREGGQKIEGQETIEKDLTIIYSPGGFWTSGYETSDWIEARSIALVTSAVNKDTNIREYEVGTAWIIAKVMKEENDWNYLIVTTRSYKIASNALLDEEYYKDQIVGVGTPFAAKKYVQDDDTTYLNISLETEEDCKNNDLMEVTKDDGVHFENYLNWYRGDQFVVKNRKVPLINKFNGAPDLAVGEWFATQADWDDCKYYKENDILFRYSMLPQINVMRKWAQYDEARSDKTLHPERAVDAKNGQISSIFTGVPSKFKEYDYQNGVVAGFSETKININNQPKKALCWNSYEFALGGREVRYIGWEEYAYAANIGDRSWQWWSDEEEFQIRHNCGCFVQLADSVAINKFFTTDSGRGSMFVLRPKITGEAGGLDFPTVAGINWNGRSRANWSTTISPFFDDFIEEDETGAYKNFLEPYMHYQ